MHLTESLPIVPSTGRKQIVLFGTVWVRRLTLCASGVLLIHCVLFSVVEPIEIVHRCFKEPAVFPVMVWAWYFLFPLIVASFFGVRGIAGVFWVGAGYGGASCCFFGEGRWRCCPCTLFWRSCRLRFVFSTRRAFWCCLGGWFCGGKQNRVKNVLVKREVRLWACSDMVTVVLMKSNVFHKCSHMTGVCFRKRPVHSSTLLVWRGWYGLFVHRVSSFILESSMVTMAVVCVA